MARALRASQRRFRSAIEALPDPFAIHSAIRDETGRIVDFSIDYVNVATTEFNGLSAEQQTGRRLLELFPAMPDDGLFDAFVRVVETGEPFERESVVYEDPNAAGGPIHSVLHVRAVKFGDGYIVSSRDLTAHARAEAALRASEDRYRTLVEQSTDAIFVLDADGRVVEANTASEELLGYAQGALQGRRWDELITPDDLATHPLHFAELREGATLRFERQMRHADGALVHVELSAKRLPDGRFLEIARDISVRKAAEAELRRTSQLLEATQAVARVGGWELDVVRDALFWTAETYRIHETSPAEYTPTVATAIGFYAPESIPVITAAVQDAVEHGTPFDLELDLITAKGRRISVRATSAVTTDDQGRTSKITGAFQDITERKRLETQLGQAQRLEAVGQLAGGVAHDFNNLLTAIRGYAEMLGRNLPSDDEQNRADIDQVISAADRAAALTGQLLAFSRRQVLQPKVIDPAEVVQGVAPMLGRLLGENIELITHLAPDIGFVKVDPGKLEQVVVNLAVNAHDAMPDGGRLIIELSNVELDQAYTAAHAGAVPGPHVLLAVSDAGTGMDEATQAHIFEPFFTTKEPGSGTGMGLATVYGIVKQSGGSIYVYSEPGHGTTFRIYLPRVSEEPTAVSETAAARPSSSGTETILLVEDDPAVRGFARRTLKEQGYTVIEAAGGADALSLVASHEGPIALLVTDVIMPGMQGHQLAAQLTGALPELRVLYVSGFTENSVIDHGVPEHGVAFLPKPFSAEALVEAVRRLLDGQAG
jgi:PAS domain S-box-containing protein